MRNTHGAFSIALSGFQTQHKAASLTLSVPQGTCMALLGIGQETSYFDTLTQTLAGHIPSLGGTLTVSAEDVTQAPPGKRRLGTLSHNTPLFPHLKVRENIALPLKAGLSLSPSEIQHRTTQAIALLGLDAVQDQSPSALMAELTFRVCLARLLILNPGAIVLNNPFMHMDQATAMRLLSLLEKLQRAIGLSILLLTQSRTEAVMAADTIGIIKDGTLLQTGTAETLLSRPAHESVLTALGDANTLTGKVLSIEDDYAILRLPSGETVEAMSAPDLAADDLATICILPERLSVIFPRTAGAQAEEPDLLVSTLVSARHTGNAIHMRFRLRDGTEITVCRPPVHQPRELQAGREAFLAWQTSSATAFPMDQRPLSS